ncbi:MAG: hypothetical protein IC227_00890 [Enterococcus lacertideformus]|uniref:Uncharacterized protein n=1 Tax=Enterococcus lacertideformus TaxID=2771493 RepID=A0A931ASW6_9ENTE|nr:hypothetical protein [Enterococcus lacertideformus]
MKKKIKYILPNILLNTLKKIRNYIRSIYLFKLDKKRFVKNYSKENSIDEDQLKARLIFYSHSIEKGLARENLRYCFGGNVIPELYKLIKKYKNANYDIYNSVYLTAISVLNQYINIHEENNYDISSIINIKSLKNFI